MIKAIGKLPAGRRLQRIKKSVQYREGIFHNILETPLMAKGVSYLKLFRDYFKKHPEQEPVSPIPFVKNNLHALPATYPVVVWLGHSSYFIMVNGFNILVDPVFSNNPSPISWLGKKAFITTHSPTAEDFPVIDLLIITHDHYDHLDYKAIMELDSKVKQYCTSLGVGAHLEYWGIGEDRIVELDWWENHSFGYELQVTATPARHFSGRGLKRNQTLWSSFVIKSLGTSIFCGGDSGYDDTFKTVGEMYGPFDMAILDCAQYDDRWPHVHMVPEQTVQACINLNAKWLLPVHWAKFALAYHPWKEPLERLTRASKLLNVSVTTPKPGELIILEVEVPRAKWWEAI
jgi:L-ascorbate metabolism protein UlaG (beta-lactamase superfamily)